MKNFTMLFLANLLILPCFMTFVLSDSTDSNVSEDEESCFDESMTTFDEFISSLRTRSDSVQNSTAYLTRQLELCWDIYQHKDFASSFWENYILTTKKGCFDPFVKEECYEELCIKKDASSWTELQTGIRALCKIKEGHCDDRCYYDQLFYCFDTYKDNDDFNYEQHLNQIHNCYCNLMDDRFGAYLQNSDYSEEERADLLSAKNAKTNTIDKCAFQTVGNETQRDDIFWSFLYPNYCLENMSECISDFENRVLQS